MRIILPIIVCLIFFSCTEKKFGPPQIIIKTSFGDITAELYPDKAPQTVTAFLSYIDSGYYKNTSFYRVLKADELPTEFNSGLIQGGLWPTKKNIPGIPHESTKQSGLSHINGTLSLARMDVGSASTEFFICIGEQTQLDSGGSGTTDGAGYAAFGKVLKGMDAVRKIQAERNSGDQFTAKILIIDISRL